MFKYIIETIALLTLLRAIRSMIRDHRTITIDRRRFRVQAALSKLLHDLEVTRGQNELVDFKSSTLFRTSSTGGR